MLSFLTSTALIEEPGLRIFGVLVRLDACSVRAENMAVPKVFNRALTSFCKYPDWSNCVNLSVALGRLMALRKHWMLVLHS